MRWLLGLFVMLTAAPALAFEGEVDAKSIGNTAAGVVEFQIYVSKNGDGRRIAGRTSSLRRASTTTRSTTLGSRAPRSQRTRSRR